LLKAVADIVYKRNLTNMTIELPARKREKFGKANRSLRKAGNIPAELYGRGIANLHLMVKRKDFDKVFQEVGETGIVELVVDGERRPVLIHSLQRDYLSREVVHVDFHQIRMDEKITAHVPLEIVGESPAVKSQGGILNRTISELEVRALPSDLPSKFTVDISGLTELNQSVYVRDLKIPPGVEILISPETVLLTVTPPTEEEVAPAAPTAPAEVKVETEEKKAEREKERTAGEEKE
jgi:large subunit ribosomal protein L25